MRSQVFDLYPVLRDQFEADPSATSIDICLEEGTPNARIRRVTRAEFERERLVRDVRVLNTPIARSH